MTFVGVSSLLFVCAVRSRDDVPDYLETAEFTADTLLSAQTLEPSNTAAATAAAAAVNRKSKIINAINDC